ncbi:MAG: hypothetical protein WCE57_13395, partial [Salegentibacter sp.]
PVLWLTVLWDHVAHTIASFVEIPFSSFFTYLIESLSLPNYFKQSFFFTTSGRYIKLGIKYGLKMTDLLLLC